MSINRYFWKLIALASCIGLPLSGLNPRLQQADELFEATLYPAAIEIYTQLLEKGAADPSSKGNEAAHVRLRLAQAHYAQEDFEKVIQLLAHVPPSAEGDYLLGLAYRQTGQLSAAIAAFERYLLQPASFSQEARLELGMAYFLNDPTSKEARAHLEGIKLSPQKPTLYPLAQIYLARLDLQEGFSERAEKRLRTLQTRIPSGDPLYTQTSFWLGRVLYQKEKYAEAAQTFAAALPQKASAANPLQKEILHNLVDCYLKLSEAQPALYYDQAEELLRKEIPTEQTDLALAQLYLLKADQLKDAATLSKGLALLRPVQRFTLSANRAQALLLLSQVAETPSQKEEALLELTQNVYRLTPPYAEGWYRRGRQALENGFLAQNAVKTTEASHHFAHAALYFGEAAKYLEAIQPAQAAQATKLHAEALWHLKSDTSPKQALEILDQLTTSKKALLESLEDRTEIYYLQGLIAFHLGQDEVGEKALRQGILGESRGKHTENSLFLLASRLHLCNKMSEAEQLFIKIPTENPESPLASQALFFAARCAENGGSGLENAKAYRKRVFDSYPHSQYAAEAYFFLYPYREYLQGDRSALKHLQAFQEKFAQSPYHIVANYLVGMDYKRDRRTAEGKWIRKKDMNQAIEAFQNGETTFDELHAAGKIPVEELPYFLKIRYRSTLERALANLAIADDSQGAKRQIFLEYAEEVFRGIAADLQNSQHVLTPVLVKGEPYPALLEESSFWLAQTYIKRDLEGKAERVFNEMLDKYAAAKITRGYYLSRVWYELGQLALRNQDPKKALENFTYAEDAAKGKILSTDQRIDLWIQQSIAYAELKDYDRSMLMLSKAINSDEVSSLRVKALYLRADIYAKQGRRELARRQLEATSKKGGEWALKAKQRWEQEYGFQ